MFNTPQARLVEINKIVKRYYPNFNDWQYYYRKLLKQYTRGKTVLDIGCGKGGIITEFKNQTKQIIGLDDDASLLNQNKVVDKKIVASLDKIPLTNNIIDTAVSTFVIEHVASPDNMFKEIFRILAPGGSFIFITSNVYNPVMFFSKLLPYPMHKFLREKLLHKSEEGTHQTYYQANTCSKLYALAMDNGFKNCQTIRVGNPEYLSFSKVSTLPAVYFEKAIDNKYLAFLKMYIMGICQK